MADRADAPGQAVLVGVDDEIEAELLGALIAERDHLLELPRRVDVHQRERQASRCEGLQRQMQEHRRILADRIEHHRVLGLGDRLPHDVNALGFETLQVSQTLGQRGGQGGGGAHRAISRLLLRGVDSNAAASWPG